MSNSIDQRIVEMQFDNAKFNENVKSTITAMEDLDRSMTFGDKGSAALSKLSSSLKNVGSSGIVGGLTSVKSGLMSIADAAHNTFSALVNKAGEAARAIGITLGAAVAGVGAMIVSGGTKRALNLEHANFQLQGLLKSTEKVKQVMDDVGVSVDGTAYGLDEAAVVASQLAASNVQASEAGGQMLVALRGVAGVAAMGGAEYSRVGQIFTTVAGQGRLMGDQLLQMSSMGLNAASTLKDYYNHIENTSSHTEEEIRDMVSKGKVDFETFAAAMDWAFGEHATKANETFTGALSNVKAALSRIGAEFAIPSLENLRKIFVGLIPVINTFKKAMAPMVDLFKEVTGNLTTSVTDVLGKWATTGKDGKVTLNFLTDMGQKFKIASLYAKAFIDNMAPLAGTAVRKVSEGFSIIGRHVNEAFSDAGDSSILVFTDRVKRLATFLQPVVEYLGQLHNTLMSASFDVLEGAAPGFVRLGELAAPALKVFGSAFSWAFDPSKLDGFRNWGKGFSDFISTLDIPQSFYDNLSNGFTWLFTLFNGIGRIASGAFDGLVEALKGLVEGFIALGSAPTGPVADIIQLIADLAMALFSSDLPDRLRNIGTAIGDFFRNIGKNSGDISIFKPFEAIGKFFGAIRDAVSELGLLGTLSNALQSFGANVKQAFANLAHSVANGGFLQAIADFGKSIPTRIIDFFKGLGDSIRQFIEDAGLGAGDVMGIVNTLVLGLSALLSTNVLRDVGEKWYTFVSNMARGVLNVAAFDLDDRWKQIKVTAKDFVMTLSATFKVSNMLKIALAIGILVGALWLLTTLDPDQIATGLITIGVLMGTLIGAMNALAAASKNIGFMQLGSLAGVLVAFGGAIFILAVAVRLLGSADMASLGKGLLGFAASVLILVGAMNAMSKFEKSVFSSAMAIGAIASAMLVLTAVIAIFGHMKIETLVKGLSVLGISLLIFVGTLAMLGQIQGKVLGASAAIMILAQALLVIAVALRILGGMSFDQLAVALVAFGGSVMILAAALTFLSNPKMLAGAAAMVIAAAAILLLTPALMALSGLSFEQLAVALIAIAGAIAVFAIAALLVKPVVPAMLELAGAMALLSLSVALVGAGLALFAVGLATIVAIGSAGSLVLVNAFQMLVTALLTMLPQIAAAVVNTLLTIFQSLMERTPGLCSAIVSALSALISMLATLAPQFIELGVLLLLCLLQAVQIVIPEAINTGVILIVALANGLLQALPTLLTIGMAIILVTITTMADLIRQSHEALYQAGKELFLAIIEALADMFGMLLSDLGNFLADIPAYISGEKELFSSAGKELGNSTTDSAKEGLSEMPEVSNEKVKETIEAMRATVDSDSKDLFSGVSDSLNTELEGTDLGAIGTEKLNELKTSLLDTSAFQSTGEKGGTAYTSGTESGLKSLPSKVSNKFNEANNAAKGKAGSAKSGASTVGSSWGSGMASGMDSWRGRIGDKAASMVREAKARANAAMNAASPAKDLIQSGIWFGQGFEIGITRMIGPVGDAAAALVDEAKKPFTFTTLLDSADMVPWDSTPTIRPILDLTDYQAGLNHMQGLNTSVPRISAEIGNRLGADASGGYYNNTKSINIELHYGANASAAEMVNAMASALQTKNLMEA